MAKEIEWRFMVTRMRGIPNAPKKKMVQAYFNHTSPGVRVRFSEENAFLTIKSDGEKTGANGPVIRHEFEYEIPVDDAKQLVELCNNRIVKTRYYFDGIELDVFEEEYEGLVLAEVEVEHHGEMPEPPEGWEWENISSQREYSNQSLALNGLPQAWKKVKIE